MHLIPSVLAILLAIQNPQANQTYKPDQIEAVDIRGNKLPSSTIRNQLRTKKEDTFDQAVIDRDVKALYAFQGGLFDDVKALQEPGTNGGIVIVFQVSEKRTIDSITYVGLKTFTKSDVTDKLHEKKISLSKESKYDPTVVTRAVAMLKVLL